MKLFQVLVALAILSGSLISISTAKPAYATEGRQELHVLPCGRRQAGSKRYRQVLQSQRSFAGQVRGSR